MSLESTAVRKLKRIVRCTISGFVTAKAAIIFGNTVEKIIVGRIGVVKFKQQIAGTRTILAITKDYVGETTLKLSFLGLHDHNTAVYVIDEIRKTVSIHEETYDVALSIIKIDMVEKPQPQFLTNNGRPPAFSD